MIKVSYNAVCDHCGKALAVTDDRDKLRQKVKENDRLVTGHGKFFCDLYCLHQWIDKNKDIAIELL